ncbi:unnamed protein product, partial [Adineta ricciae]
KIQMGRRSKMSVCGNGIVEIGEDCDCGLNKSCVSVEACCNPRTCQFYSGAECLSGACCSGCKLLPAGYPCRASRNTCDTPEVCDGTSAQCPDDDNFKDGSSCQDDSGTCFHGTCSGAQQQCVDLWGPGSKVAHESCYTNFNPSGSMTGHCGYDSRLQKYIPCFNNDVKCGLLHCEGGMPYPRVASSNFMIFSVNTREGSFECKSISSPTYSILVSDGNMCGESSFCQNNTCIEQKSTSTCHSQTTCSGNGICTAAGLCYCNTNWKGKDCSIYDIKHQDAISYNRSLSFSTHPVSPTAFAGVATITFLLFTLLIIITCLFRNKKRSPHRKPHELTVINHPQVTVNPTDIQSDRPQVYAHFDHPSHSLVSTPVFPHRTPLHRSPYMASNRSITSACTGLSYLPTDTPRSLRYTNRKLATNGMFSDSETPRTRVRRQTRDNNGLPSVHSSSIRHPQTYATLSSKRLHDPNLSYQSARRIYDDIDKLSTNENLRDFIQALDSFAQEKFGGETDLHLNTFEQNSNIASSPTETNESITLDSGYQSTKQLMNTDEYAVVVKTKRTNENVRERRRSYSSSEHKEHF